VEIMIEQVQPQNSRWLRGLRHRHDVRRDSFDIVPARLLRERLHVAERIILEVGDFGWHEGVDPSLGSHDVGEETGPVAVAWISVTVESAPIHGQLRWTASSSNSTTRYTSAIEPPYFATVGSDVISVNRSTIAQLRSIRKGPKIPRP
jgi:hypothetical protein